MSISSDIERIKNAKSTLKTYLTDNDVAVADETKIDAMANQLSEVKVGASSAEDVSYTNSNLPGVSDAKGAFDALVTDSHTHTNKTTLDKLADADGILTYDGKSVDGSKDFIIQMTVSDAGELVSCDKTFAQLDAAYKAGKNPVVVVNTENNSSDGGTYLPLLGAIVGEGYIFSYFYDGQTYTVDAYPDEWSYTVDDLTAADIGYTNSSMPNVVSVYGALGSLIAQAHTHSNKSVLDLLSAADGKLQYDGSDVGLKGDKGDAGTPGKDGTNGKDGTDGKTPVKGTDYWTAADKAEIVKDTLAALPKWTGGSY